MEISAGELIDKITILELKLENIHDDAQLANISCEYASLVSVFDKEIAQSDELVRLRDGLKAINSELWRIEENIRAQEKAKTFGPEFVTLARSVYLTNDRRSVLNRKINELRHSDPVEEKSYGRY